MTSTATCLAPNPSELTVQPQVEKTPAAEAVTEVIAEVDTGAIAEVMEMIVEDTEPEAEITGTTVEVSEMSQGVPGTEEIIKGETTTEDDLIVENDDKIVRIIFRYSISI